MGRRETRMPGQDHDIMLAHAAGKPVARTGAPKVMEHLSLDARPTENLVEVSAEVLEDPQPRMRMRPLPYLPELLNVGIPLGLVTPQRREMAVKSGIMMFVSMVQANAKLRV